MMLYCEVEFLRSIHSFLRFETQMNTSDNKVTAWGSARVLGPALYPAGGHKQASNFIIRTPKKSQFYYVVSKNK